MVDYMQKAADLIDKEPVRESDWTREGIMKRVLATTLEALDKEREAHQVTKAELQALREGVARIASEHSFETDASIHPVTPQEIAAYQSREIGYIRDFARALIQPEPDPLVEVFVEAFRGSRINEIGGYWEIEKRFREALARHGLAVKEVG